MTALDSVRVCSSCDKRLDDVENSISQVIHCKACEAQAREMSVTLSNTSMVSEEECCADSKGVQVASTENNGCAGESAEELRNEDAPHAGTVTEDENKFCIEPQSPVLLLSGILEEKETEAFIWTEDGPPPHWAEKQDSMLFLAEIHKGRNREAVNSRFQSFDHTLPRRVRTNRKQNLFAHFRPQEGRKSHSSDDRNHYNEPNDARLSPDDEYSNQWTTPKRALMPTTNRGLVKMAKNAMFRIRRGSENEPYVPNNRNDDTLPKAGSSLQGKPLDESQVLRKAISWMRGIETKSMRASSTFSKIEEEQIVLFEDLGPESHTRKHMLFEYGA